MTHRADGARRDGSPHVRLDEMQVGIPGVDLFLHDLSGIDPSSPMKTSRFTIAPTCGTNDDSHDVHELWFITEGRLSIVYDGREFEACAGEAVYFQPPKLHRATNVGERGAAVISVWWP